MPKQTMTPIDSTMLASHGYDQTTGKMRVQFKDKHGAPGDTWEYDGISPDKYAAFTGAHSHGGFFMKKIKPHHNGRKV